MKIISKFKDYYDYIAYQYGGGDPLLTYDRRLIDKTDIASIGPDFPLFSNGNRYIESIFNVFNAFHGKYPAKWLLVADKLTLLTHNNDFYCKTSFEIFNPIKHHRQQAALDKPFLFRINTLKFDSLVNAKADSRWLLVQRHLSKERLVPCITFEQRRNDIIIDPETPNLGELGLSKLVSPEQMYQELALFLPLLKLEMPTPPSTNLQKTLQHGFDAKQSFRHRHPINENSGGYPYLDRLVREANP